MKVLNIQRISSDLYLPTQNAEVIFNPNDEEVFVFKDESYGREVDIKTLIENIQYNLSENISAPIIIPTL